MNVEVKRICENGTKIKVRLDSINKLGETLKKIQEVEKEYNRSCTLLEIEIGY